MTNLGKHLIKIVLPKEMNEENYQSLPHNSIVGYNCCRTDTEAKLEKMWVDRHKISELLYDYFKEDGQLYYYEEWEEIAGILASNLDKIIKIGE